MAALLLDALITASPYIAVGVVGLVLEALDNR